MMHAHRQKAFTIVEVAVVLLIIGLLTVAGTLSYNNIQASTRNAEASEQLAKFGRTVAKYKADNGAYPATAVDLTGEYAVSFKSALFSTTTYYNLLYCTTATRGSYALTATTQKGKRIFVKNTESPAEYKGSLTWTGSNGTDICESVLTGSAPAGLAGWRESGEAPTGWRPWVNAS